MPKTKKLTLMIKDEDGNLYEVEENIEDYDLTKPFAATEVLGQIMRVLFHQFGMDQYEGY